MKPARAATTIDLDALARQVAPLVASLLVARLTGDAWPRSSRSVDAPAGVGGRRWPKIARQIGRRAPGARFYTVEREDWDRYLGAAPTANDPTWTPAQDLPRLGLRAVR